MNPLIIPFLREVLHAALETELVSTWLDHLVKETPTKLDDMFLNFVRNVLGVESRDERDAAVTVGVTAFQKMYNEASPAVRAELKAPAPVVYSMADIPVLLGFQIEEGATG